jgi:hypothetical protein
MGRHDAAWLAGVEAHVREAKAGEALRRRGPGGGRAQAAAATVARDTWLREKVEASVFARVLQDIEDRCLNCVRLVLQGEGWLARSWQQDGLLVEDMGGRQLRGGGSGGEPAVVRLEAAMRKAEAAVLAREKEDGGRSARQRKDSRVPPSGMFPPDPDPNPDPKQVRAQWLGWAGSTGDRSVCLCINRT